LYHPPAVLLLGLSQVLEKAVDISCRLLCQDLSRFAHLGDDWVLIHCRSSSGPKSFFIGGDLRSFEGASAALATGGHAEDEALTIGFSRVV
jgi:hypothetical protein